MKNLFITQLIFILLVLSGIMIELIYQADLGFMAITIGSLLFAVTTKIENYFITKRKG